MQETLLKNEQGFTLLELMVVLSILGVLTMLAVPKFSSSVAVANTVRIQSDLQTINTAIAVYQSQNGVYPQNIITDLSPYLSDAARVAPPQGECFL
ncbi:MAG: type II secretion system protein, partial [Selenomonadaceae bacterium]